MASVESAAPAPYKKSVAREYLESLVVAFILATFIRTFVVQAFKIPTGSMEKNLLIGDHLLVNKVVFIDGRPLEEPYVHFLEPPLQPNDAEYGARFEGRGDNWGPEIVPPGQLFVLGDNRDNSKDSRYWKFLPVDQVKGRALMVYWSYEASREEYHRTGLEWLRDTVAAVGKTRWRRFFHLIR